MNLQQIKDAVNAHKTVHWQRGNYIVTHDSRIDQWYIKCLTNGHLISLTWSDGQTMNGHPSDFYIGDGFGNRQQYIDEQLGRDVRCGKFPAGTELLYFIEKSSYGRGNTIWTLTICSESEVLANYGYFTEQSALQDAEKLEDSFLTISEG